MLRLVSHRLSSRSLRHGTVGRGIATVTVRTGRLTILPSHCVQKMYDNAVFCATFHSTRTLRLRCAKLTSKCMSLRLASWQIKSIAPNH